MSDGGADPGDRDPRGPRRSGRGDGGVRVWVRQTMQAARLWSDSLGRQADPAAQRRVVRIRRYAYTAWAVFVTAWIALLGFPFEHYRLLGLICLGLFTMSIGRRPPLEVIRDWIPFVVLLAAYDLTRWAALAIGMPTQWHLAIDVDRWMFAGVVPTVWLQERIKFPSPPWWEVAISAVYISYFVLPFAVAATLWIRDRTRWRRFLTRFFVLSFAAIIGYVLVPAAPPWAAAKCTAAEVADHSPNPDCMFLPAADAPADNILGVMDRAQAGALPQIERISTRGWNDIGLGAAQVIVESGQKNSNMVAAIPSMHAGLTALVAIFMMTMVRKRWWPLWIAYAVAMAFVLVYTAEHYVFDIILGWGLAGIVMVACRPIDRRWERRLAHRAAAAAGRSDMLPAGRPGTADAQTAPAATTAADRPDAH